MEEQNMEEQNKEAQAQDEQSEELNPVSDTTGAKKFAVKKRTVIVALVIVAVAALAVLAYFNKGLLIAAMVNGSPISRLEIIKKLEKASGKNVLDSLITRKLIFGEANANKIVVSEDEINAEIKKYEDQIAAQGGTLDEALAAQGMSRDDLKKEVILQLDVEKLLADKISVTDAEVAQYIKDNKVTVPKGQEAATNEQIKSDLKNQKLNTEAPTLINDLKAKAKIQYFVNY